MRGDTVSDPDSRSVLSAAEVSRLYRNGRGVRDINLSLASGEIVGLMGPNGSGKTTLLRALATADLDYRGTITWFGSTDPRDPNVRRRLGVVLDQLAHFEQMTGFQNAWFFARQFGLSEDTAHARIEELFRWAGLQDARDQRVSSYSLGMKRKLTLVEALVHRPQLLFLDEPTLALDYRSELDLIERLDLLRLTGVAVLLATNDVHLAERVCDRVLFLHQGGIIREGRVASLLTEVAGAKEVELRVHSPVSIENLRRLPAVEALSVEEDVLKIVLAKGANPAQVLAVLDGASDLISTMKVSRPNLGDLFLKLTGVALPEPHR
jgi:ABC-2 type transport system ATP-binding protein